jgi:hypothetical protein
VGLSDGPSGRVAGRTMPYAFTLVLQLPRGAQRELDLVAPDAAAHDRWTRGVRLLLHNA